MTAIGWIFFTGTFVVLALGLYIYMQDRKAEKQRKN